MNVLCDQTLRRNNQTNEQIFQYLCYYVNDIYKGE